MPPRGRVSHDMAGRGSRFHAHLNRHRWADARRAAFDRDGWRCRECGRPGRLEAHHVTPLHKGGDPYDLANVESLCRSCHIDRHRRKLSPAEVAWNRLVREMV